MYLVQILLPLYDNHNQHFPAHLYNDVSAELTERFRGLTAYSRAPAEGLWKEESEKIARDDIVIFEVMAERLDKKWWRTYREEMEKRFRQEIIIIRADRIELL